MSSQQEQLGNQVAVDFGDEVPYALMQQNISRNCRRRNTI